MRPNVGGKVRLLCMENGCMYSPLSIDYSATILFLLVAFCRRSSCIIRSPWSTSAWSEEQPVAV